MSEGTGEDRAGRWLGQAWPWSRRPRPPVEDASGAVATDADLPPYADAREHLLDELARLDLRIRLQIASGGSRTAAGPLEQLRGLVLSDGEVADLLSPRRDDGEDPETRRRLCDGLEEHEARVVRRRAASLESGVFLTLPHLAGLFGLSRFEEEALLLALAPELDRKYEKLYAYLQDDVTRKRPTVELLLRLAELAPRERLAARVAFDPRSPLLEHRLVQLIDPAPDGGPLPLIARALKLDERIVDLLLDHRRIDPRLEGTARVVDPELEPARMLPEALLGRLRDYLRATFGGGEGRPCALFHLRGRRGSGRRALAAAAARELGLPLLMVDAERLLAGTLPAAEGLWRAAREALLLPAVLAVEGFDALLEASGERRGLEAEALGALARLSQLSFLLGHREWRPPRDLAGASFVALALEVPDAARRAACWQAQLAPDERAAADPGALASMFRFTPGQIRDAVTGARDLARWRGGEVGEDDLYAACRAQSNPDLVRLARKIVPRQGWEDLVLPSDVLEQLHEICHQARQRSVVLGEWGFERKLSLGTGISALFSGPPGTGKTLAAEVIARELGLDLYKIDLSQVVSKYIGETEKNLDRVFTAAEHGNAILFFDEADALFGKRSEVRDSHDRYANVEISYLLQKMEEYRGLSILATNLRQHLDTAFLRRLSSIVELPFPDAGDRERIWQVTFPSQAPVGEDVDFAALGRDLRLAGGNIKNIGLAAAYRAAGDGGVIRMEHLLAAARREYQKLGRSWSAPARPSGGAS